MHTRRTILALGAGAILAGRTGRAEAQAFPSRPITFVVPFAPGGSSDVIARSIGQKLSATNGWSVVVENKPGAASTIGAAQVARSAADGHTILLAAAPFVITQYGNPKPPYDARRDFVPVTLLVANPLVVTINPKLGVKSFAELLAYARASPGKVTYGTPGIMSLPHLATELMIQRAGVTLNHVPYNGGGPAVTDLLAGHIDMFIASPVEVLAHVRRGALAILAVTSKARLASLPDVPTVHESGLPDYEVQAWFGVTAPAGVPEPAVRRLNEAVVAALRAPDVAGRLAEQGVDIVGSTAEAFGSFLEHEHARWSEVARAVSAKG